MRLDNAGPVFAGSVRGQQSTDERCEVLRALVASLPAGHVDVLEIGSWVGHSARVWRDAIARHHLSGSVLCVDPLEPYLTHEETAANPVLADMQRLLETGAAAALFRHNAQFGDARVPVRLARCRMADIAPYLERGRFAVVYVDGSHRYADVLADLRAAERLVAPGGLLCGDDLEAQAHELDAAFLAAHGDSEALTQMPDSHRKIHAGVTRAVAEHFRGPVWTRAGVWAMQRAPDGHRGWQEPAVAVMGNG